MKKREADLHEHSHVGEPGHGAVDHGDHVHEVLPVRHEKGVSCLETCERALLSCVSLNARCGNIGAEHAARGTNRGRMVLQGREQVEANAVAAEGDTAEKAKLTQALIKVRSPFCRMSSQGGCPAGHCKTQESTCDGTACMCLAKQAPSVLLLCFNYSVCGPLRNCSQMLPL